MIELSAILTVFSHKKMLPKIESKEKINKPFMVTTSENLDASLAKNAVPKELVRIIAVVYKLTPSKIWSGSLALITAGKRTLPPSIPRPIKTVPSNNKVGCKVMRIKLPMLRIIKLKRIILLVAIF